MDLIIVLWVISFLVAAVIGSKKGNPIGGVFLGLILGPVGAVVVMLSSDKNRIPCKYCAEKILKAAKICPHCHKELT